MPEDKEHIFYLIYLVWGLGLVGTVGVMLIYGLCIPWCLVQT